jgi:hypothetical protein
MPINSDIIHTRIDSPEIFQKIYDYYGITSIINAPRKSIEVSKIRFYQKDANRENDYLEIGYFGSRFMGWNIHKFWFIPLFTFQLPRSKFNTLISLYNGAWHTNPTTLHSIFYMSEGRKYIIFFFELMDGPGGGGNSAGVKVPSGQ